MAVKDFLVYVTEHLTEAAKMPVDLHPTAKLNMSKPPILRDLLNIGLKGHVLIEMLPANWSRLPTREPGNIDRSIRGHVARSVC